MAAGTAQVSGKRRVGQLLIALGPEVTADVFRSLSEDEVAELSAEVADIGLVSASERRALLEEFYKLAEGKRSTATGGTGYARAALSRTFGEERASEIIERVRRGDVQTPSFHELEQLDPIILRDFLRGEHPQIIAVVLAHFTPARAGAVISALDNDLRCQVLTRLAQLGRVTRDMVSTVQATLKSSIARRPPVEPAVDGPRLVARILNSSGKDVEEMVLGQLGRDEPELFETVQRQMFLFEDLVLLDGRSVQKVLRGVDAKTLSVAMKAATEDVQQTVFKNMSKRAAAVVKGELEVLGPLPVAEVEKAQREIIDVVRTLEREGDIVVPRGGADDLV